MRRREFITLVGGAVAWPITGQARPAMSVIGFLHPQSPEEYVEPMRGFRQGLKETGYVEGENLVVEYRWANNQIERLSALAADLVRRRVAVIAATGGPASALAAQAATTTIPIVFNVGDDPVAHGLVASLARPGGNLTGVNNLVTELSAKRLELLRELVPGAARMAVLVNPASEANTRSTVRDLQAAAHSLGLQIQVLNADTGREIDAAFESIGRDRPDVLFAAITPFFVARRIQLVQLAAFHRIPAAYGVRDFAEAGGLLSYGVSLVEAYRQVGIYTGRILKGAKPADLPVMQSSKLELVVNTNTARMLGITVPQSLLTTADKVIE
jgi:putative ABC transport system substrate-binding protein